MRYRKRILVAHLVLVLTLMSACGSLQFNGTERQSLAVAAQTYKNVVQAATTAYKRGALTDEDAAQFERWRKSARSALDAWRDKEREGEVTDKVAGEFFRAIQQMRAAIEGARNE